MQLSCHGPIISFIGEKFPTERRRKMSLPKFNETDKYVVTAVNPVTGAVAIETWRDGDYTDWDLNVRNDEQLMNQDIANLIKKQYAVVVTQSKLDQFGKVDYQLIISINPLSVECDCGKGIICPLNVQQVNYWHGQIVPREMRAK